jgi:hypothetical protein
MDEEKDFVMDEDDAKAYLKRKGKPESKDEIKKVMTRGKIYGDPLADIQW